MWLNWVTPHERLRALTTFSNIASSLLGVTMMPINDMDDLAPVRPNGYDFPTVGGFVQTITNSMVYLSGDMGSYFDETTNNSKPLPWT